MTCCRWVVLTLCKIVLGVGLVSSGASAQEAGKTPPGIRSVGAPTYYVFPVAIQVQPKKANGSSWDPAEGKPDIRVIISNERSGKTFLSVVAKDTLSVTFDHKTPVL